MKKKFVVLFILMISLFSAVQFALASPFPGNVEGSTATTWSSEDPNSGKGTVKVTEATTGVSLTLYEVGNSNPATQSLTVGENGIVTFSNVPPGQYQVTATSKDEDGQDIVYDKSKIVTIKPAAVLIKKTISPEDGSEQISVSGGDPEATFTLYNPNITGFTPIPIDANAEGKGVFDYLLPGKGYQVRQTVNGVTSDLSKESITIRPKPVEVTLTKEAGPSNNQGEITITGAETGNTLSLYRSGGSLALPPVSVTSPSGYTFSGLSAGTYYVVQTQNGVDSANSDSITLADKQIPVIELTGDNPIKVVYDPSGLKYIEPGAIVKDNIDPDRNITIADNPIPIDALPGVYTLKYNTEDQNKNKAAEVTRTVIIAPNKVTLTPTDTSSTDLNDTTGEIKVTGVVPATGVTLYLYQDIGNDNLNTNDILIKSPIQNATNEMTIYEVPVGRNYYIIQEYGTVQSLPSDRIHILDKTPPKLKLNGDPSMELTAGDRYVELGASAEDNVDLVSELNVIKVVKDDAGNTIGAIDTSKPGIYTITYSITDKAGNGPVTTQRTVTIKPQAVTAIGSTADLGEIGVKNVMPGSVTIKTTLTLYKFNEDNTYSQVATKDLVNGETTYVFKKDRPDRYGPGRYYVMQTVNGQTSAQSNVVDIVDIDRPYITLEGPEKLSFVWKESGTHYDGAANKFTDPGATAKDYIDGPLTDEIHTKLTKPDGSSDTLPIKGPKRDITFSNPGYAPGVYTITYSVTATRGAKADDKKRTITVAPPKTSAPTSTPGTSTITIPYGGVYNHATTVVKLYNTYDQLIDSIVVPSTTAATFDKVPAGIGYYVTQTVNGVESAPSDPVNVSLHEDAEKFIGFTSFKFKDYSAQGVIDEGNGTITVTLPFGSSKTNLTPVFTVTNSGTAKVGTTTQTSGTSTQDFTNPVTYTISNGSKSKDYKVTVNIAKSETNVWLNTIKKDITLTENQQQIFSLTSTEKTAAAEKGISFIAKDTAIHVSAANVKESSLPTLTVKDIKESSFVKSSDPSWRNDLSNIMEIGWGGSNESLLQPIEVEIPDLSKKLFVRLIREDNKLYAIIQPNTSVVGWVTEPGVYATLDRASLTVTIKLEEPVYRLTSSSGASIFYTTDSKQIGFDRSARLRSIKSYSFTGTPADLANWSKYQTSIINPGDELYAVAMYNQIISPVVEVIQPKEAIQWKNDIPTVSRYKVWSIQLNEKVDKKSLFSDLIYVTDDSTENQVKVNTILQLSIDGKTITVAPTEAYDPNRQYTLWLDKQIQGSTTKEFLKQPIKMTFIAK